MEAKEADSDIDIFDLANTFSRFEKWEWKKRLVQLA
jgi:hypothetical protein